LRVAQRETSPQYVDEFEPITHGFLFAVIALGALSVMVLPHILWRALVRTFSRADAGGH